MPVPGAGRGPELKFGIEVNQTFSAVTDIGIVAGVGLVPGLRTRFRHGEAAWRRTMATGAAFAALRLSGFTETGIA
jgi:hypothetical protein